jgi:protein SCO1/2
MARGKAFTFIIFFLMVTLVCSGKETQAATKEKYTRTVEKYVVPDVTLVNQNGARVNLRSLLSASNVVMIDFIFTTCTTICPVLSAGFANFQRKVGQDSRYVRLVSISIDPENDTPRKMKEYLTRYDSKPGWDFLTGSRKDIKAVLDAFQAYTVDKMYHMPLALLHSSHGNRWVRIYGLIGTSDLVAEYRELLGR